ncbi:hypothetical protein MMC21_004124 [Puttea exsequens]|nr:hypothetical protein [Puttea exsequens]
MSKEASTTVADLRYHMSLGPKDVQSQKPTEANRIHHPAGTVSANEHTMFDVTYVDSAGVIPQGASAVPPAKPTTVASLVYPSDSTLAPETPSSYVTGQCFFDLKDTDYCESLDRNLFAVINLKDGAKKDIGDTTVDTTSDHFGVGINDSTAYNSVSKLPHPLLIMGEYENDYVQFTFGGLSWSRSSRTPNGDAYRNIGAWDPEHGALCYSTWGGQNATRDMEFFLLANAEGPWGLSMEFSPLKHLGING